jgi:MFS family permease
MSGNNMVDPVAGAANDVMGFVTGAWEAIKPQIVQATMITAILTVPMAVLGWFVLVTFGPFGFGAVLLLLLALAQLVGTLILTPALVRFVLGVHLGQPVDVRGAIMEQVADRRTVALNFLVFGIVAGIAAMFLVVPAVFVAVFVGQIYFVEGKRHGDAIGRNFELVKRDIVAPIVNVFVPALVFGIGLLIAGYILGVLPLIGGLMGALGRALGQAIMLPVILMLCTRLYFQQRRRFEGGDPEGEARARLGAPALPGT